MEILERARTKINSKEAETTSVSLHYPGYKRKDLEGPSPHLSWYLGGKDFNPGIDFHSACMDLNVPAPSAIGDSTLQYDDPELFEKVERWAETVITDKSELIRWYPPLELGLIYQINALCAANPGVLSIRASADPKVHCELLVGENVIKVMFPEKRDDHHIALAWSDIVAIRTSAPTFLDQLRHTLQINFKIQLKMPRIKDFLIPSERFKERW